MMERSVKRPAFQWYPGDHRRDTGVQACEFEARALWREMMDLMHDGEPYGHLTAGGVPIDVPSLARLVGMPSAKVARWLEQLEAHKVFSRTDAGVIYSRRMVRDEHIREVRAASGKKGGNPALVSAGKGKAPSADLLNQIDKEGANQTGKQKPTPAVAVASAVAVEGRVGTSGAVDPGQERTAAAPLALQLSYGDLPEAAIRFVQRFYPRGTDTDRRRDVAEQLLATLGEGARLNGRAQRVRAVTAERLAAKCAEVLAQPPKDGDKAIVVLLRKLADTSDGSAPGHVAERAATAERAKDERTGAERAAAAEAWLSERPDVATAIEALLDAEANIPRDPRDPIRRVMWRAKVVESWSAAGEPEVQHA